MIKMVMMTTMIILMTMTNYLLRWKLFMGVLSKTRQLSTQEGKVKNRTTFYKRSHDSTSTSKSKSQHHKHLPPSIYFYYEIIIYCLWVVMGLLNKSTQEWKMNSRHHCHHCHNMHLYNHHIVHHHLLFCLPVWLPDLRFSETPLSKSEIGLHQNFEIIVPCHPQYQFGDCIHHVILNIDQKWSTWFKSM